MSRPNHTSSWPELTVILLARLSVLWMLILISQAMSIGNASFYAVMGMAFAASIPYSLWLRNRLSRSRFAWMQFGADFMLAAALIHFTGGIHSDFTPLYSLIILTAGIAAPPQQAVKIVVPGVFVYVLITALCSRNVPMDYVPGGPQPGRPSFFSAVSLHIVIFSLTGLTGMYISRRCTFYSSHIRDTRHTVKALLDKVHAGILLLDRDGQILSANETACEILHSDAGQLKGRIFAQMCITDLRPLPDHYNPSAWIERRNAPPIPIALRRTEIELPAAAVPGFDEHNGTADITLLVMADLTRVYALERKLAEAQRTAAAARAAGEMAHDIRTPLTTISASIQLLQQYEMNARTSDWLPNSPRMRDRTELFNHILGASEQMDHAIQHFVDFAEFSPTDLISIIKLDSIC